MGQSQKDQRNQNFDDRLESYGEAAQAVRQTDLKLLVAKGATMTAAAAAVLSMAASANATINYSGIQNIPGTMAPIDLNSDANNDFIFGSSLGYITPITNGVGIRAIGTAALNFGSWAAIGPSNTDFVQGYAVRYLIPNFGSTGTGLAGIYLSSAGGRHFGWIRISMSGGVPTFVDWAWESVAETPIPAGVPEPTTASLMGLGLLAMGARGVRHRRKRLAQLEKTSDA